MRETLEHDELAELSSDNESKKGTFPVRPMNGLIPFIGNVYKKYGASDYHSIEIIADANDLSVNSIKSLVSTGQQYSFLIKSHGTGYKITDQFAKIFHPQDDSERMQAAVECIKNVPFYKQLIKDYEGQVVPSIEGLVNVFVRKYEMKVNRAKIAAEVFTQNLRDYELINSRNILILKLKSVTVPPINTEPLNEVHSTGNKLPSIINNEEEDGMIKIPIRLKGKRMAYLSFPDEYDDQDLLRILRVIKAYVTIYNEKDEPVDDV